MIKRAVYRRKLDSADFDLQQLSRASAGLTGTEIEVVFLEAMFSTFERSKEPTDLAVASALNSFEPLSRLMAEQVAALKQWSIKRARPATSHSTASEPTLRKLGGVSR